MARLDLESKLKAALSQEKYLEPPKRFRRPRRLGCRSCFWLTLLLVLIFITLTTLAALAKTGIWQIPVFSRIFYQIPQPTELVKVNNSNQAWQTELKIKIDGQLMTLEINNEQLTYILRQLLTTGLDPIFAANLQGVITGQQIEIFGLMLHPVRVNLTLMVKPVINNQRLDFELKQVKVGDLAIPPAVSGWLPKNFLSDKLTTLSSNVGRLGELTSIELSEGKIILTGKLNLGQ